MARRLHKQSGMFSDPAHLIPDGDMYPHSEEPDCGCKPQIESGYVPGIGGAVWFKHRLVDPESVAVPDSLPEGWL